ncbi:MAG: hypothetical protein JNK11_10535 [Alphaproteobacteria bacterium]|nr:hypothetical protein [Alphaproteobacteria bacterium]
MRSLPFIRRIERDRALSMRRAFDAVVVPRLRAGAKALVGRFVVFGSFARGGQTMSSDVGIAVDFGRRWPEAERIAARACSDARLRADICYWDTLAPEVREHAGREGLVIDARALGLDGGTARFRDRPSRPRKAPAPRAPASDAGRRRRGA